jgi:exosortase family protein XrtF
LLRAIFIKYKKVIRFIVLFLGTYFLLSVIYFFYLEASHNGNYPPDFITNLVAKQSSSVINGLGYEADVIPHEQLPTMKLYVNKKYLAHIIEGCNAVSIIILFIAFVVAFSEKNKKTFIFLFAGTVIIYIVNIARITIMAIALYKYPQFKEILHTVIFPGLIYGMVFILWMIWVRMLNLKIETTND